MELNEANFSDLGFNLIRNWLAENSQSTQNSDLFKNLLPDLSINEIKKSNIYTNEIIKSFELKKRLSIGTIPDSREFMNQLSINGSKLSSNSFKKISIILTRSRALKKNMNSIEFPNWKLKTKKLLSDPKYEKKINSIFDKHYDIKPNASPEFYQINIRIKKINDIIKIKIKSILHKAKQNGWLQEDQIVLRNNTNTLAVKIQYKNKLKGVVHGQSASGQTLFIEPLDIIKLNNDLLKIEFERNKEKNKILKKLTDFFHPLYNKINYNIKILEKFDWHYTIALFAINNNSIAPKFSEDKKLFIQLGVNPVLKTNETKVIPLNINIDSKENIVLLSGPNAGGKTVVLKTIGLFCIMSQSGLFIPAKNVRLPFIKKLLIDIGDNQSLENNLSTFSAHIKNISVILKKADSNSLILLDEMGTGTDPNAGAAISQSILEDLLLKKALVFATTHIGTLKSWAQETKEIKNGCMKFDSKNLVPSFELQLGIPGSSYAIEIITRLGLENNIVHRSKELIGTKSIKIDSILQNLEKKQTKLELLDKKLKHRENQIKIAEKEISRLKEKVQNKYKQANLNAQKEAKVFILKTRQKMENLVEKIRTKNADTNIIKKTKIKINQSLDEIDKEINSNQPNRKYKKLKKSKSTIGSYVYIPHLNIEGKIIVPPNKKNNVTLEVNGMKIILNIEELSEIVRPIKKINAPYISINNIEKPTSIQIDLRGKRVEQALSDLDIFLNRSLVSNLKKIYILHGKGTGALMESIQKFLKKQPFVKSYKFANDDIGGVGLTEVILK